MQQRNYRSILSFCLLLFFISMQMVQTLHFHSSDGHSAPSFDLEAQHSKHQLIKTDIKCLVCDYGQQRIQEYLMDFKPSFELDVFDIHLPKVLSSYGLKVFKASIHTWTNKGPPVSLKS